MTELTPVLYVILGLILRIGIPLGITIALGSLLKKLDARWQAEAKSIKITMLKPEKQNATPPCWEYMNCSPGRRDSCPVYGKSEVLCWDYFKSNGTVRTDCRVCTYRESVLFKREALA